MSIIACSFAGCDKPAHGKGLCSGHCQQARRGVELKPLRSANREDRFWQKVDKTLDCWLWTGVDNGNGYGQFWAGDRMVGAHRYSFELANGSIPPNEVVDHECRNRACVNPAHLRTATHKENQEHRSSELRGVSWDKARSKWTAYVTHNRKQHFVGRFSSREEAAEAARLKRLDLFTRNNLDR